MRATEIQPPTAGPGSIGQLAAIAAGYFTDIIDIIAPQEAAPGDLVTVEVRVKNLHTGAIYTSVTGSYNGVDFSFSPDYAIVQPGAIYSFTYSFTMPNNDVRLHGWSFYWGEGAWYQDDYSYVDIALAEAVEPYAGTIGRKELEHDGTYKSIPVYDIPQGERGLVHIWGRNDMATAQRMGIYWIVYDPDGFIVEEYSTWEAWPYTGAGDEHEFIGGRFDLSKSGTYTINIALSMNPAAPEIVDSYYGTLCTVAAAVPEPEFSGFGIAKYQTV